MGEACSLCSNVEVLYHHVHMRFIVLTKLSREEAGNTLIFVTNHNLMLPGLCNHM
jgi:hypothetical protein